LTILDAPRDISEMAERVGNGHEMPAFHDILVYGIKKLDRFKFLGMDDK